MKGNNLFMIGRGIFGRAYDKRGSSGRKTPF
jgi:hypothetical protein